ncbi:MAG: dethiobiotin synthetase [Arenicella sp.]|jgi:dethiobiotin synthetase
MISADLAEHQRIANAQFNTAEYSLHAPYLFKYPASPHLSASMEDIEIDCDHLEQQTRKLESQCEHLLIEGAGGLCVPLNDSTLMTDLVAKLGLPIVLVTSSKLGSINHTILSLDYCVQRDLDVRAIIYNEFLNKSQAIFKDSRKVLKRHAKKLVPNAEWFDLKIDASNFLMSDELTSKLLR